jgi:hypothetical protein
MNDSIRLTNPDSRSGMGGWSQLAQHLLALFVVLSLALSSLGPMLDHHFPERHPGHSHLYFGTATVDHNHVFERVHSHRALDLINPAAVGSDGLNHAGIVFFSPYDGTGIGAADLTLPLTSPSFVFKGDGPPVLKVAEDQGAVLRGTSIAPPRRPPPA